MINLAIYACKLLHTLTPFNSYLRDLATWKFYVLIKLAALALTLLNGIDILLKRFGKHLTCYQDNWLAKIFNCASSLAALKHLLCDLAASRQFVLIKLAALDAFPSFNSLKWHWWFIKAIWQAFDWLTKQSGSIGLTAVRKFNWQLLSIVTRAIWQHQDILYAHKVGCALQSIPFVT